MPRWAVSYINWDNRELATVIVHADSYANAIKQHPKTIIDYEINYYSLASRDTTVECVLISEEIA